MSEPCNLVVIVGRLSGPPRTRTLPSGTELAQLDVTVQTPRRRADSVPVVVFDPARAVLDLAEGDAVVVTGSVRRRFFRRGGTTASATEVVADHVVKATRRAQTRRAAGPIADRLDALLRT